MTTSKLDPSKCVRLYDGEGKHIASLLVCGVDENDRSACVDLALPGGKVLYCGVDNDLVDTFVDAFGEEPLDR